MNIGDIAEMAGVSRAAVSRYLNNGYISAEKRERIRRVIEETGYQPSVMAQTLRTKKTKLIGVVLPRIHSDAIAGVVEGIGAVLHDAGYDMLLATTDNVPEKELDYLRIFANRRVDGIILIATVFTKEHKKILKEMAVPIVITGQMLQGYPSVSHENYEAGAMLTRHLLGRGYRKIGYLGVMKEDVAVGQRRCEGCADTLLAAGIPMQAGMHVTADFSAEAGREKMQKLLSSFPEIDAVICATDELAFGAMTYLKEAGKRVPEDVAVAGFDDDRIAAVTTPGITSVRFQYRKSGECSAGLILDLIKGTEHTVKEIRLGTELVVRGSTTGKGDT